MELERDTEHLVASGCCSHCSFGSIEGYVEFCLCKSSSSKAVSPLYVVSVLSDFIVPFSVLMHQLFFHLCNKLLLYCMVLESQS